MSIPKTDRWMQVEWNSGRCSVVNARYLLKSLPSGAELKVGTVVTIGKQEGGAPLTANVLASARERHLLQEQPAQEAARETDADEAAQKTEQKEQEQDYSPSASDWEPTDETSSEESEEEDKKPKMERSNMRQYTNRTPRRVLTPTHRPNAVIPHGMQQLALQNLMNRKSQCDIRKYGKTLPDSTKRNKQKNPKESVNELISSMKDMFNELFKILSEVKPSFNINDITDIGLKSNSVLTESDITENTHDNSTYCNNSPEYVKKEMNNTGDVDERMDSEYSDRSDDNVLITNKYDTVKNKDKNARAGEWVPIGSGTTLIHKDKYRKVNWKSYTIATRTLLLAAFSRKTLATHSLTGKKSPAFTNKPAKMCLDPKIVSDIVIEITDKFQVKDNLVRSIITTKCADECKMLKMKINKLGTNKKGKNQENIPPTASSSNTTI